jgi:hypothetical protein
MKKIFFFLLCLASLVTQAQIVTCHTDTLQQGYYKDSIKCYTVVVPKVCTDTVGYNYFTSNCHKVKISLYNRKRVCDTIKIPIANTRDCSTSYTKCDTLKNYFYFPPVTKISCDTTYAPAQFGAKLQGKVDSQLIGHKALLTTWNRTGVILPFMDGKKDNSIMQFLQSGYNVFINLSCNDPRNNPQPWYRDTVQYEKWLRTFFQLYKTDFDAYKAKGQRIVFGHDNEPLNQNYHGTDSIENYFTLARTFNKVCHENGMETADGSSFVETIYALLTGYNTKDANLSFKIYRQAKYIALMKTAGFNLSNSHWGINDDSVTDNEAQIATDYLVAQIGIPTCSNEYHYYMATSAKGTIAKVLMHGKKQNASLLLFGAAIMWKVLSSIKKTILSRARRLICW